MKKNRLFIISISFLLAMIVININAFKEENRVYADSNTKYSLVVEYFEYWIDSSGNYYYEDKDGISHNMGKEDPGNYLINNYPVYINENIEQIKSIYTLNQYRGHWKDLNYAALSESEVKSHYLDSAFINKIDIKESKIITNMNFYPLSTEESCNISFNKWRNYITMIIEYEQ